LKEQKYYVVWKGVNPGIYRSWDEAKKQIHGVEGARYKSFTNAAEAKAAFEQGYVNAGGLPTKKATTFPKSKDSLIKAGIIAANSICVDAACSGNPGDLEYRGVETVSGNQLFHIGPLNLGTNNIGEFLALVHAGAGFLKSGRTDVVIYTDSITAMAWVRDKKIKSKLPRTHENKELFELVDRALQWLQNNNIKNPIRHWNTPEWGEIPADFGRK